MSAGTGRGRAPSMWGARRNTGRGRSTHPLLYHPWWSGARSEGGAELEVELAKHEKAFEAHTRGHLLLFNLRKDIEALAKFERQILRSAT